MISLPAAPLGSSQARASATFHSSYWHSWGVLNALLGCGVCYAANVFLDKKPERGHGCRGKVILKTSDSGATIQGFFISASGARPERKRVSSWRVLLQKGDTLETSHPVGTLGVEACALATPVNECWLLCAKMCDHPGCWAGWPGVGGLGVIALVLPTSGATPLT